MQEWRGRLATAPAYVLFLFFAIGYGGLGYLLDRVTDHPTSWVAHLVGGLLFGLTMTAIVGWQRRRMGGAQKQNQFLRAVKDGQLPPDADPAEWAPLLERKIRSYRRWQPWAVVEFAAFTALAVWLALGQGPVWWIFAAFFAGFGGWIVLTSRRSVVRMERMQRQLAAGSASDPIES